MQLWMQLCTYMYGVCYNWEIWKDNYDKYIDDYKG